MIFPLASFPFGEIAEETGAFSAASGTMDFTGAAVGAVKVTGAGSSAFFITGTATQTGGYVEQGSLLSLGPIMSGALMESLSIFTPVTTVTGAAAGAFDPTGTGTGVLPIIGRAPDIVLASWSTTVGAGSVTIGTYPAPPTTPAWLLSVGAPGYTVVEYPNYAALVSNVPFINFTGTATGTSEVIAIGSGSISFTCLATGSVPALGIASGSISFDGAAVANARIGGTGVGTFDITAASTGRIGNIPVSGIADGTFDFVGDGIIAIGNTGIGSGSFDVTVVAAGAVSITGAGVGVFDLGGSGKFGTLSSRRSATPKQSANDALLLTGERIARILGA